MAFYLKEFPRAFWLLPASIFVEGWATTKTLYLRAAGSGAEKVLLFNRSELLTSIWPTWPGWPLQRRRQAPRRRARGSVPPRRSTDSCPASWELWTTWGSRCVSDKIQNRTCVSHSLSSYVLNLWVFRELSVMWPWWFMGNTFLPIELCWLLPVTSSASCSPVSVDKNAYKYSPFIIKAPRHKHTYMVIIILRQDKTVVLLFLLCISVLDGWPSS